MTETRRSRVDLLLLPILLVAGTALWLLHAEAWDLGVRSPILSYDAAQYAIAARQLAWHGRLATPFALPIELVSHPSPPWPLSTVQPGLVLFEALVFKLVPARGIVAGSDPRAWLTLLLPFCSFLFLGASLALSVRYLFARWWPEAPRDVRLGAAFVIGLSFLLDPEAQHFATSGFTELPFTVGLLFAYLGLALGAPGRVPLAYGLVLGVTGLFRANMLWLAPLLAVAGAWSAPEGRRLRTAPIVLLGWAFALAPWWIYKWHAFGSPSWDLTRYVVWDGVQGRSWFSIYHVPRLPDLPHGFEAVRLLAAKVAHNTPTVLKDMLMGPRGVWLGGLVGWLLLARPPRPLAAAGLVALGGIALAMLSAAASIPWLRYLFPNRVLFEAAGILALGALLSRLTRDSVSAAGRRVLFGAIAVLALSWGAWSTARGNDEARATARERGMPSSRTITALSIALNARLASGEPVMSNLGPSLAWGSQHPVVSVCTSPADVAACRRLLPFRNIVLVVREGQRTWPAWNEILEREGSAATVPGLDVIKEDRMRTRDGFLVVWLELGPLEPAVAAGEGGQRPGPARQLGLTSCPGSSPSSTAGYSAGSSRRFSTKSGTSSERFASASGPSPTRITL